MLTRTHPSVFQLSQNSTNYDDALSASLSPPLWPTLSPATNTSSEVVAYNWGPPAAPGAPDASAQASRMKYRSLSYRTTLCRHFLKNDGWCPMAGRCN